MKLRGNTFTLPTKFKGPRMPLVHSYISEGLRKRCSDIAGVRKLTPPTITGVNADLIEAIKRGNKLPCTPPGVTVLNLLSHTG